MSCTAYLKDFVPRITSSSGLLIKQTNANYMLTLFYGNYDKMFHVLWSLYEAETSNKLKVHFLKSKKVFEILRKLPKITFVQRQTPMWCDFLVLVNSPHAYVTFLIRVKNKYLSVLKLNFDLTNCSPDDATSVIKCRTPALITQLRVGRKLLTVQMQHREKKIIWNYFS